MKNAISKFAKSAAVAALLAATLLGGPARAQIVVEFPPADFIATTTPVYYQGRAHYWYNGRWYYRDGGRWGSYHDEPVFLHDYRGHHEPERRYYEGRREDWGRHRR